MVLRQNKLEGRLLEEIKISIFLDETLHMRHRCTYRSGARRETETATATDARQKQGKVDLAGGTHMGVTPHVDEPKRKRLSEPTWTAS